MKLNKICKLLLAFSLTAAVIILPFVSAFAGGEASYTDEGTGRVVAVIDKADLLSDTEEADLLESMKKLTQYCSAFFITQDEYHSSGMSSFTESLNDTTAAAYGVNPSDSTVFLIDMYERELYIHSGRNIYKVITKANANTIADNTYTYASKGDYYTCAKETFDQMYKILDGQKIARPMKYITAALLAIFIGLFIGFIILRVKTRKKDTSDDNTKLSLLSSRCNVNVNNFILVDTVKVRHVESSGGGGGGGSSGGGGGGGGGGHSF